MNKTLSQLFKSVKLKEFKKIISAVIDEIRKNWPNYLINSFAALLIAWIVSYNVVHSVIAGHGSKIVSIFKNQKVNTDPLLSGPIEFGDSGGFHAVAFYITDKRSANSEQEIKIKIKYDLSLDGKDWLTVIDDRPIENDFIDKKIRIGEWYYKRQSLAPAKYIRYNCQLKNLNEKGISESLTFDLKFYKYF